MTLGKKQKKQCDGFRGHSDEALVQAAGKGDLEAFTEIVSRHQDWAWRIAHRFIGDKNEAADIVQDAFLRLWNASGRYRPTARFRTYFYRIITRICMDRAKKKNPLFVETIPDSPDPDPGAADAIMRQETAAAVRIALDFLPPKQRMAIVFRYYEELSYKDIASALETTPKAVERLLARAREGLRSKFGDKKDF